MLLSKSALLKLNNYFIGLIFLSNSISIIVGANGIYPVILFFSVLFLCIVNWSKKSSIYFNFKIMLAVLVMLCGVLCNGLFLGISEVYNKYILQFLLNGILISFMCGFEYRYKSIILNILPLIVFISLWNIINQQTFYLMDPASKMGFSYSLAPLLFFSFYLIYEKNKIIKLISIFVFVINTYLLLSFGSRGTLLSFLMFLLNHRFRKHLIHIMIFFVLFFGGIFLFHTSIVANFDFDSLNNSLIKRIVYSEETDDLSSGRNDFYNRALSDITSFDCLWGRGIGAFGVKYDNSYPHNLFIHIFYEMGIIGEVFFILLLLYVWIKNRHCNNDLLFTCFCLSIPRLMLSSYLWQDQFFWMFIFYGLALSEKK